MLWKSCTSHHVLLCDVFFLPTATAVGGVMRVSTEPIQTSEELILAKEAPLYPLSDAIFWIPNCNSVLILITTLFLTYLAAPIIWVPFITASSVKNFEDQLFEWRKEAFSGTCDIAWHCVMTSALVSCLGNVLRGIHLCKVFFHAQQEMQALLKDVTEVICGKRYVMRGFIRIQIIFDGHWQEASWSFFLFWAKGRNQSNQIKFIT